jgi:dTDP-4-amino-4,6-dideoxygalactose transaminase
MLGTSFPPWPNFSNAEVTKIAEVLASGKVNYWTGTEGKQFEEEFASYTGAKHAVALSNGTAALELALKALDIGSGDEVIVPSRTFIATASAVVAVGATPVFADIDRNSGNLTAATIASALTQNTKGVICVHLAGWPCDMDSIMEFASQHQLKVIEDCAQAHGAIYKNRSIGTIGDIGCWSFCQDKILTTAGEGGMATTNDQTIYERMWAYKDHGKSYHAVYRKQHKPGYRWLHDSFGTNWRMPEVCAAVGRLQLLQLNEWKSQRHNNAKQLSDMLDNHRVIRNPHPSKNVEHAYYKYYAYVVPEAMPLTWSRDRIVEELNARGVPCFQGTCSEIYKEKAFENHPSRPDLPLPVAHELGETALMFLVHPTITSKHMERMTQAIDGLLKEIATDAK